MFVDFILVVIFIIIAACIMCHFANGIKEWAQNKRNRKINW